MSTTTPTHADARNRAVRTFWTGLGVDVLVAACAALLLWLPDADLTQRQAWIAVGVALVKTVLAAAASYVVRLKVPPAPEPGRELVYASYADPAADLGSVVAVADEAVYERDTDRRTQ